MTAPPNDYFASQTAGDSRSVWSGSSRVRPGSLALMLAPRNNAPFGGSHITSSCLSPIPLITGGSEFMPSLQEI